MINYYKLINNDKDVIVYLYLNFNEEFAKITTDKDSSFFSHIKDYLKKHNLLIDGARVVLVIGGVSVATITLALNTDAKIKNSNSLYIKDIDFYNEINKDFLNKVKFSSASLKKNDSVDSSISNKKLINKVASKKTTNSKTNASKKTVSKKNTSKKTTNSKTTSSKKTMTVKKTTSNTNKKNVVKSNTSITKKPASNTKEKTTMINVYRSSGKVLSIELETYLIGVVAAEMPASFNMEALKAQAVVARTYALKTIQSGKKLTDTTSTQVYNDNNQLKKKWGSSYQYYYNRIKSAVDGTKGIVVKYNGNYIEALFYSMSNGYTEDASEVWGSSFPYLTVVSSPWDKNVSGFSSISNRSYKEISNSLGIDVNFESEMDIISRNKSGRVSKVKIGDYIYSGVELRSKLSLRSSDFDIVKTATSVKFTTRGFGHGVGMSQYGANAMAKNGKKFKQIITYYYPGVNLSKI